VSVLTNSIDIPAPADKVWAAIGDLNVYAQWMTLHSDFPDGVPDTVEPGVSFREKVKIMGMPGDVTWTVADYQEERRIQLDGEGPMGVKLRAVFELEPTGDGTHVSYESEFSGAALAPLLGAVEKEAQKAGDESLANLKEVVAGEKAPA
jgi:carbon monoxide dehydrogenase subunit G